LPIKDNFICSPRWSAVAFAETHKRFGGSRGSAGSTYPLAQAPLKFRVLYNIFVVILLLDSVCLNASIFGEGN
jgi:hypothetical protein